MTSLKPSHSLPICTKPARPYTHRTTQGLMQPPDPLPKALNRVQRHLRGLGAGDASDDEIEIGNSVLALRDPITGTRMSTPARFSDIDGLTAFDLEPFLAMAQRTLKWLEPHSLKGSCIQRLQVSIFMSSVQSTFV